MTALAAIFDRALNGSDLTPQEGRGGSAQPRWVKLGLAGATEALNWGCHDLGGTLMEELITSMAGAQGDTAQTVAALQGAIASQGRPWRQRDTLYQSVGSELACV